MPTSTPTGTSAPRPTTAQIVLGRVGIRRDDYAGAGRSWRRDLIAGLTVAVVALPLALGFGVNSGAGAAAGLVTAVIAGLVAAVFGGSHLQVSGPTGAMTVVLVPLVARYGVGAIAAIAVLAGLILIAMGLSGLGNVVSFIPWPVIEGFTLGIAVIIAVQQVPLLLAAQATPAENAVVSAVLTIRDADWGAAVPALAIAGATMALIIVISRVRRSLPSSLIAIVVVTVVAVLAPVEAPTIGELPAALPVPSLPHLPPGAISSLFSAAFAVAALAALESLLSAKVADGMVDDLTRTQPNRELVGQGLANVASGLFGGLPATGAIARTAVNARAGARTRIAATSHAVFLAIVVGVAGFAVAQIPLAALGGVLVVTAGRMINLSTTRAILRSSRAEAVVFATTVIITVVFDLVLAVEVGVAVAALLALRSVAKASTLVREPVPAPDQDGTVDSELEHALLREHIAIYRLDGALFFGDYRRFLDELLDVADIKAMILRLGTVRVLDSSGATAIGEIVAELDRRGVAVLICGVRPNHQTLLHAVGPLEAVESRNHVFTSLDAAIEHAHKHVRRDIARPRP